MGKVKNSICSWIVFLLVLLSYIVSAQPIQMTSEFQSAMQKLAQSNYEHAIEALTPLLSGKNQAAAMVEIGRIRVKQAQYQMSRAIMNFSIAADMMNNGVKAGGVKGAELPKTLYDLAKLYEERIKNFPMAVNTYEEIIEEYPTFLAIDKVYFSLAYCQEMMGMMPQAAENYRIVVTDYSYSTHFATANERMKDISIGTMAQGDAIEAQEGVVEDSKDTEEAEASMNLGDMQAEAGNYSQAANAYRQAINSAYEEEEALEGYRKLIDVLDEKQKDYEGAATVIKEMLNKYPDVSSNGDMIYRLGRIYEEDLDSLKTKVIDGRVRYRKSTENIVKAISYYDDITNKYPDADVSANAFLRKGELYEKELRDYDQAKRSYKDFLSRFPEHDEASSIREKLEELDDY